MSNDERTQLVYACVVDCTNENPLVPESEMWFQGRGSIWMNKYVASQRIDLAERALGAKHRGNEGLIIYPNGRLPDENGKERGRCIRYGFTLPDVPLDVEHSIIEVRIFDKQVIVSGMYRLVNYVRFGKDLKKRSA